MPLVIILVLSFVYFRFKEVPAVKGVLHGASAAAVALTLTMVIKTGQKCLTGLVPVLLFGGGVPAQRGYCAGRCWGRWRSWRR